MTRLIVDEQLSALSRRYLDKRPKSERSPLGQFFTPRSLRNTLVERIDLEAGMRVLDPGVGTGEFLLTCQETCSELSLEGWDIDPVVAQVAKELVPKAEIKVWSALEQPWREDFDVVIGNPPYFEIRNLDPAVRLRYKNVIGGRPNIFSLFFAAGLGALKPGGILGFVVPPSMNNGAYFSKLRAFISSNSSIDFLKVYSDSTLFLDAQTAVQLIVLRKGERTRNHIVDLGALADSPKPRQIFTDDKKFIEAEFESRQILWNLGYEAVTGSVVWNANRDVLRQESLPGTVPLLWAHNISATGDIVLSEDNRKKPQHIVSGNYLTGPAILVNRITGSVGHGSLRCALVPEGFKFLAENHINVIRGRAGVPRKLDFLELVGLLRKPGINARVQKLTGNTQVSCVELTHFLPLDFESDAPESSMLF